MLLQQKNTQGRKIGLVLGGGGARGLAHIGVAKVLAAHNIEISYLAGCSMGGIIAATLALRMSIDEIEKIARRFSSKREIIKLVDRTPTRKGLLAGKNIRKYLSQYIDPDIRIEDTPIPLFINAVDLISGKEVLLEHGNLLDALMATTAVPGFFPPVEIDRYRLVDGGVLNDVPVKYIKKLAAVFILAVDVHHRNGQTDPGVGPTSYERIPLPLPGIMQDFYRVQMIMTNTLVEQNLVNYPPDLLISPTLADDITTLFGFNRVEEIIKAGEAAMREKIPELIQLTERFD